MKSILRTAVLAAAVFSPIVMAAFDPETNTNGQNKDSPAEGLSVRTPTDLGCFSAPGKDWVDMGVYTFQTSGWCHALCIRLTKNYFANVNGTNCFCGSDQPPSNAKLTNGSACDQTCSGFDKALCGGINLWRAYDGAYKNGDPTGSAKITIPDPTYTYMGASATSSSSSVQATVVITQAPTQTPSSSASAIPSSGPNTAAIAAGIVVAVVVVAAIAGGLFFFMRRRKQQALAEEQRRHEMMTSFVTGEKPPGSGYTSPDSRLDPSMMFSRRLSDGSIRDNEDYSRRILKVANPDA